MWKGILLFELGYHTRRLTFAAAVLIFAFMGFMTTAFGTGPADIYLNSPYTISYYIGLLSLVSVFAVTLFSAQSVLRDTEHQMAEIVYTTSLTKLQYLLGRFAGSFLAAAMTVACAVVGMVLGTFLIEHDPAMIGPFQGFAYLWSFAVLALPNVFFAGSLLFAVAALSRSTLMTYVGGVALYMLYFLASMLTNSPLIATSSTLSPEGLALAALADPFGLSAFFEQTHYLTTAERNTQHLELGGYLLGNRLLFTGLSAAILGLVYRFFAFRLPAGAKGAGTLSEAPRAEAPAYRPVAVGAPGSAAGWQAFISATRLELRYALKSWPFVALIVMWLGMNAIEIVQFFQHAEYGTALLPTTGLAIRRIQEPLGWICLLMIVYYSAELAWRERTQRMHEIVDSAPASSAIFLFSKALTLTLLLAVLTAVAIGVAIAYQLSSGYGSLELGAYLSIFYFTAFPLVLVAFLALFLQTVCPNRYLGMLMTLVAALVLHKGRLGGPEHPLLRFAIAPEVRYSAMNGFGPAVTSFSWFMLYWSALSVLIALATYGLWRRGTDLRLRPRLAALPRAWGRGSRAVLLAAALVFLSTGSAVFYQTNVVNAYETAEELGDFKADYERTYRHLEEVPQPTVTDLRLDVDLFPQERRYEARGRYRLKNAGERAIPTVWVTVRRDITRLELSLAGQRPTRVDERFRTYTFDLASPLPPGAEADLAFDLTVIRGGAVGDGEDRSLVANGTFLLSPFLPSVGYRRSYELRRPYERRRRGLPEYARPATVEAAQAAGISSDAPPIGFETTVSTVSDQTALAPGTLRGSWEKDGRRYFRYVAEEPIRPIVAYVSARYAVERVRHGEVDVEVYYHPEHGVNIPRFLDAATRSLEYFAQHFGPYPHPHLRIVEVPSYWDRGAGLALSGIIYIVEDRGFLTDLRDEGRIDIVTKRIAHEVAHQWWGHQVAPAEAPGASTLVESLARYSELVILRQTYGEDSVTRALGYELDRYLRGRSYQAEVALYHVENEPWLFYAKGALVMMAVHDLIGEEAVNLALSRLVADSRNPRANLTSLDLLEHLYRVTPEPQHELLDQWWKEIVLYDLRIDSAFYEPLPGGRYRVTARVAAHKSALDDGEEVSYPMSEELGIALYSEHPAARSAFAPPIYVGKHRLGGTTELVLTVDQPPAYIGVDPFLRRIDRNRADNVGAVRRRPGIRPQGDL